MDQDRKITPAAWPGATERLAAPAAETHDLVPARRDAGLPAVIEKRVPVRKWWLRIALALAVLGGGAGAAYYWWQHSQSQLPPGIASGNGRIEADEIDIDTKFAGRIAEMLADEGDMVKAGQVVARMDTRDLEASLKKSQAQVEQAQRASTRPMPTSCSRQARCCWRSRNSIAPPRWSRRASTPRNCSTSVSSNWTAPMPPCKAAKDRVGEAEHALDASTHDVELYKVNIADNTLVAPRDGRIQYRIANIGEVLPAGGKVFTMLDISYVYMDIYLPTAKPAR